MSTFYKQQKKYFCIIITLAVNKNDFCTLSRTTCIDFIVKNVGNVVLCCHFEAGITPCPLVVLNTKHKCNFIVFCKPHVDYNNNLA